ncbi:restriction endonuclease subunit S [Albidovulum sediminicola]|uniref:Restriction endonuclease subunit S n=1 Tax=Albidovulum sediminicola TaxID=2984331 RepID=A0ABT2Z104_9RHOB|nr:restriction endonuclease subunit S [Defluviimonas sp. WL0075]MCV2864421.1 restriction endonuclease subunit S [Defluviimonas sp. WL0075]
MRFDAPQGWTLVPLSEVATVQTGLAMGKAVNSEALELPYLRVANVQDGHLDLEVIKTVTVSPSDVDRFSLQPGDVLFTEGGDFDKLGRGTVWRGEIPNCLHQNHVFAVRPSPSKLLPEFLAALASSAHGRRYFQLSSKQSTNLASINSTQLKEFPVPLPSLDLQRKITEILRTWDKALEKLTALRALNIRRRIWLRTHLFTGKVRLPGFTGEWRVIPLSEVLHEHCSKSTGAEAVYSVSVHKGLVNQVEHLGRSFSAANTDHYNRVLPGDIVYTKSPTGDFPLGIIKQSKIDREVIVSPLYGVFTPQTYALGVILDALFESPLAARNYLHPLVQKGAKNTIAVTNSQFLEGKLRLPMDPAEQAAIADIVTASHAECAGIDAEIEALSRQKRGLMQKLLTGEWRVNSEKELA